MQTSAVALGNATFSDRITVNSGVLNQFIAIFYELFPNNHLSKPEKTLRLLLRNIVHASGKYYFCPSKKIVFEIDNGVLTGVYIRYRLTHHARKRLAERFNIVPYDPSEKDLEVKIALEIVLSKPLSQREKRYLNIGETNAYRFKNRVYVIKDNSIVTVIEAFKKKRQ